jgi:hypothetical protein
LGCAPVCFPCGTDRLRHRSAAADRGDCASAPRRPRAHAAADTADHLTPVITALYTRIIVMQVGIIFGAWISEQFGSRGPLAIVVVLKTVIELGIWRPWTDQSGARKATASANPDK